MGQHSDALIRQEVYSFEGGMRGNIVMMEKQMFLLWFGVLWLPSTDDLRKAECLILQSHYIGFQEEQWLVDQLSRKEKQSSFFFHCETFAP